LIFNIKFDSFYYFTTKKYNFSHHLNSIKKGFDMHIFSERKIHILANIKKSIDLPVFLC